MPASWRGDPLHRAVIGSQLIPQSPHHPRAARAHVPTGSAMYGATAGGIPEAMEIASFVGIHAATMAVQILLEEAREADLKVD